MADGRFPSYLFLSSHRVRQSDVNVKLWWFFYALCLWIATYGSSLLGKETNETRIDWKENDYVAVEDNRINGTTKTARQQQIAHRRAVFLCKWRHEYTQLIFSLPCRLSKWDHRRSRERLLHAQDDSERGREQRPSPCPLFFHISHHHHHPHCFCYLSLAIVLFCFSSFFFFFDLTSISVICFPSIHWTIWFARFPASIFIDQ